MRTGATPWLVGVVYNPVQKYKLMLKLRERSKWKWGRNGLEK